MPTEPFQLDQKVICWFSKSSSVLTSYCKPDLADTTVTSFRTVWKYDTNKCIDATPLVVIENSDEGEEHIRVYIGSHSKSFFCIDGITGQLIWKFEAKDRIESSATLSKCGQLVIVGWFDISRRFLLIPSGTET